MFRQLIVVVLLVVSAASVKAQEAAAPVGLWDATVVVGGVEIPFRFEIGRDGSDLTGAFFDGDLRVRSTAGRFDNGLVLLEFDQYGSRIEATLTDGRLDGRYDRGTRGAAYPLHAELTVTRAAAPNAPSIAGLWTVPITDPATSSKGEAAWRLIVRQTGAEVSASILRVDGDTGTLSGEYRDGRFVLSHFSGARPSLFEVTLTPDGTLAILQNRKTHLTAVRADDPKAATLGAPSDPTTHTRVKDPAAPLDFAFPDLNGHQVSLHDARFLGKVVIVSITGSWCPNCHDEAPFLVELDRKYRARGLEIVALSFEEAAQLTTPTRLRAFAKRYGIGYTVLLAGQPDELNAKVPQFENLNTFPTTFYVGRDGRVRSAHAGFPSPASGDFYTQARDEVTHTVEQLLAEAAPADRK